jgi:hypothetical protein
MDMTLSPQPSKIKIGIALLASANFLLAFAGGSIMSQETGFNEAIAAGTARIDIALPSLLYGSVGGLFLIKLLTWTELNRRIGLQRFTNTSASVRATLTAICCAMSSAALLIVISNGRVSHWLLVTLLSVRFALWYATRSFRSDEASSYKQQLGWVDLLFYLGIITGIIVWTVTGITPAVYRLKVVLAVDIALQLSGAWLDYLASRQLAGRAEIRTGRELHERSAFHFRQYVQLAIALVALTVGTQIVMLEFRHEIANVSSVPSIVIAFISIYVGGAAAALVCGLVDFELTWQSRAGGDREYAVIRIDDRRYLRFDWLAGVCGATVVAALVINMRGKDSAPALSSVTVFLLLAASIFVYEILALCIFNYMGNKAKQAGHTGLVALTLALMGFGGAIHYYVLYYLAPAKSTVTGLVWPALTYFWWILTAVLGATVSAIAVRAAGSFAREDALEQANTEPAAVS